MILNYFLFVRKQEEISQEVTEEFLQEYDLADVLGRMRTLEQTSMELGDYSVDFLVFEVENGFIEMIYALGAVPGLIWLSESSTQQVCLEELLPILDLSNTQFRDVNGDVLTGEVDVESVVSALRVEDNTMTVYVGEEYESPSDGIYLC